MLLPAKINAEMNSDEHAILPQMLQSELTLTVGFGTFIVNRNKSVISV
jgi:hypothetical protein